MKNRDVLIGIKKKSKFINSGPEDSHVNLAQINCKSCPNFYSNSIGNNTIVELPKKNGIMTPALKPDPKKMFNCATNNDHCRSEIIRLGHATSIKDLERYLQDKRVHLLGENKSISLIDPKEKYNGECGRQAVVFPRSSPMTAKELSEYNYHESFSVFAARNKEKIINNALPRAKHDHEFNTAEAKIKIISKKSPNKVKENEILLISGPKSEKIQNKDIVDIND